MGMDRRVCFAAVMFLALCSGCLSVDNNYLKPEDFATRLKKDGLKVDGVRPLNPLPLSATSAVEITVAGSGIGVYKFDSAAKVQQRRLKRLSETKTVYFNGIPYPIYKVSGSFIVVGLDKNKEKKRILKSLRQFK